jgi:CheY-like chemotaxis protein
MYRERTMDRKKVLIIDDDKVTLAMLSDLLEKHGFEVVTEQSGEEGLARIIEEKNNLDVVITDIVMIKMDGWALLDYVRNTMHLNDLELPIVVISAYDSVYESMEVLAPERGANGWFAKPIKPISEFVQTIKKLAGVIEREGNGSTSGD